MPFQTIKDPQTGEQRQVYVAPQGMGNQSSPAPKRAAQPAGDSGNSNPLAAIVNAVPGLQQALGNAVMTSPLGLAFSGMQSGAQAIGAGAQEYVRTGDLGKAGAKVQQTVTKSLKAPTPGATIARIGYNAGRNALQELSDVATADVPAALGFKVKPTSAAMPDAPFLGIAPALPKLKSTGPAEDLATGIAQTALEWIPAARAVGLVGKGLSMVPGAARVAQAAVGATGAYKTAKAAQIAKLAPSLQKPAAIATRAAEAVAGNVLGKNAATGMTVDLVGFDQHGGRLYDLVDNLTEQVTGTPLEVPVLNYLKSNPGDVGMQGRLKNAVEGLFVGSTVDFLMRAFRAGKYVSRLRTATPEEVPAAAAAAKSATEDLQREVVKQANTVPERPVTAPAAAPAQPIPDMQAPAYREVAEVDPKTIIADPQRFQFKEAGRLTKTGASGSLAESSGYNPELAGIISVWRDPANGVSYVVNGHNRLRLAKNDGTSKVLVRYLQANTPEEARAIGALQNIAEGQGTPVDAAKFMRDTGKNAEDMAAQGINMSGPVIAKAVPLTNLPQNLFDRATTGQLELSKAVALGSEKLDPQIINDVAAEAGKRKWSADKITQAMQEAKFAQTESKGDDLLSLLGAEWASKTSNFNQLLDVRTEAFRALREEMVALTSAAREGRKGILEAAGNQIDVAASQAARNQAAQGVEVFNRVTGYKGPVRDLLNELASQVGGKQTAKTLVAENLDRLRAAIDAEINGPALPLEQAPVAQAAPAPTTAAAAPVPATAVDNGVDNAAPVAGPSAAEIADLDRTLAQARADLTPEQRVVLRDQVLADRYGAPAAAATPERPLVKAGVELSHGTSEAGRKGILTEGFRTSEYEKSGTVAGEGVYMTPSGRYAKEYGQKTVSGSLPEDARVLDWTGGNQTLADLADEIGIPGPRKLNKPAGEIELDRAEQQALKQWALDNGYDGIQYRTNFTPGGKATEIVIYNADLANRIVGSKAAPAPAPAAVAAEPAPVPAPAAVAAQVEIPVDVQTPVPDQAWAEQFANQIAVNRAQLASGDLTMDDLLVNNVQKLESPSGRQYQPIQPQAMVEAYRAHSDLVSRPDATGIPVMSDEQITADTAEWLGKNNYSSQAVLENLKRLSGPLSAYRENLVALRSAALYLDHTNLQAGVAANRWLNGQMDEVADMGKLTAELVTAAAQQDRANRAFESVTRPLGQLLRSTQVPRPEPGSIPFDDAAPVKNIASDFEKELVKDQDALVAETIGERISPDAKEAIVTGNYNNPKVIEEFNALALNMAQSAVTPGFSQGFWRKFNESINLGTQGLMMYRSSQLLSSGITFWGNVINSALRTVEMPFTQAMGALVTGNPARASRSLMIYGQYVSNLANAFRMGVESFKVGRGLFDLDRSQVDFLDRLAAQDAQGELLATAQKGEWSMNTVPWLAVQDKSNWAMAQKRLWQGLNLSSRLQVSADSAFKTLVGQSFEYVRNLQPGLDNAVRLGMDGNSKEAWKFATDYAQAAVDRRLKDVVIDGKNILDAVMDSPYALTATRWATFTDDLWASMETRTMQRGMEMAEAKGLKGDEAKTFAQDYVDKGTNVMGMRMDDIPFFARTFSLMPRIWQMGLDSPLGPLFALVQPFNRTPGDIVKSVARKTPLAPLVDTWWRDVFSEDAMTRDRAFGDIATGAAAISLASIAMTHGNIEFTGGGPQNPDARRKWVDQEGKQPYSMRFKVGTDENGNPVYTDWISMRALDPYASLFGGLADYHELANKVSVEARERLGSALVLDLVTAVATGQLQKSYYQGFTELYDMAMGLGETDIGPNRRHPTARYIERLVASFLPYSSALRAGRRIDDRTAREVPASNNPNLAMRLFEETAGEIKNMIPGWSTSLPPKRNWITGDPVTLSGVWGDQFLPPESPWLSTLMQFNPAAPFQLKGEPGEMVLREMGQLTGRGAGFVGPRATDFTDGGKIKDNRLSAYEYEQYVLAISRTPDQFGRTLLQALEEEINSDLYQQNPQEQPSEQVVSLRAAALNQVIVKYLQLGRETFLASPSGKRLTDNKDWAEGANRDVQFRLKYGQAIDPKAFIESLR